ncbi:DUF973 family protein [Saccharolobus islandicus]|nr:DUF973 family protein [Sulfolobus islandicus]
MMLLPSSIKGLMGLWEEHLVSLPFKGLDVMDESPLLFRWEWISDPLVCPPDERCNPESMVGTMIPLEGNHRPSRVGMNQSQYQLAILSATILGTNYSTNSITPNQLSLGYNTIKIDFKTSFTFVSGNIYVIQLTLSNGQTLNISVVYQP